MIRLLLRLLGIRDYEVCPSCETLKEQLKFERSEKQQLTETLLSILKPKAVEAAPVELNQITQSSALFSRRRAALEAKDREEARILQEAKHLGKPDIHIPPFINDDSVSNLEHELGIERKLSLMPNVPPASVTITSTTGPGVAAVATVFSNVVDFEVDFKANTIKITHAGGLTITYYDYSALATLTWTISAGATAIVAST